MSPSAHRRRVTALLLALVAAGGTATLVLLAVRSPSGPPPVSATGRPAPTTTRTTTPPGPTVAPAPAARAPLRGLVVVHTEVDLVDTGRDVVSGGATLAHERRLPTELWTPHGVGPFPLVVFVHGYDKGPLDYARFCEELASSGYVVAAPSFPLEDPAQGYPLDRTHLADEAGDVSFVVTSLGRRAGALDLAPGAVAVVGHSDGADVALLVAYGAATADLRVDAVVADAPDPMTTTPLPSSAPLLLVQGTGDTVVPYASSRTVFAQVRAPVVYLSLIGADHLPPIAGGTPWTPVLDAAVARFLDATVAHRGPGPGTLADQVAVPPLTAVQTRT